ncbi:hypothetical protein Taro_020764 [Colocasia esculenta]|uniref:Uncharacterized protein n=1 Tax=Colocasia esculenta TaxID=4460 RepID=A0A843UPI7_COLES|nr:hypothetical protein [Colocasia esculenta]
MAAPEPATPLLSPHDSNGVGGRGRRGPSAVPKAACWFSPELMFSPFEAVLCRRGYSAAAALKKAEEKMVASAAKSKKTGPGLAEPPTTSSAASSWVPDPVTGYYRPANRTVDVDAAELRGSLLSTTPHH